MSKIRVLVVDDAVVIRRLVSDILNADPDLEVVATATNGIMALEKLPTCAPDVVLLDVEMPEMDGLQTLAAIRKQHRRLPVIMFSTTTESGARTTMQALALGASDYVTKPANVGSVTAAQEQVRNQLIPKIKLLCGRRPPSAPVVRPPSSAPSTGLSCAGLPQAALSRALAARTPPANRGAVRMLVIGVSTGGPNALAELLPQFPANFPVPICIVQHMPPIFTRLLAERLNVKSPLRVSEAVAGTMPRAGEVWIAPGDFHLSFVAAEGASRLRLTQDAQENSCRPAVDVLFRSAASVFGPNVLAVVLTGMGQDGLRGCEAIREAGGQILAQDEESSVVWGMPGFVARAGLAEAILPLGSIATEIVRRVQSNRLRASPTQSSPTQYSPTR